MIMNRRIFLHRGTSAIALAGFGSAIPSWLARAAQASTAPRRPRVLVALFQRGAMDGLNAVVPFTESAYYAMRPTIAIAAPANKPGSSGALDLDGRFALHPSLAPLHPLWKRNQLAIVHAAGSPDATRSHFDAQDFMESGTPGVKSTRDGWLNRTLGALPAAKSPLRAVSMGARLPRAVRGANPAIAVSRIHDFKLHGGVESKDALESMYASTPDAGLSAQGRDTFEAIKLIEEIDRRPYSPGNGAFYPSSAFGANLQQIARLIKADVGVQVAFADIGGWDTHTNETRRLPGLLADFAGSMAAFAADLGDRFEDVTVVTMSEFGRAARENGSGGTDHGHANAMFVASGNAALQGGRIHGRWPGLEREQLFEGRDLAIATDFRSVLAEVVMSWLNLPDAVKVFPGAPASVLAARPGLFAKQS